jgi:hypothetical protein
VPFLWYFEAKAVRACPKSQFIWHHILVYLINFFLFAKLFQEHLIYYCLHVHIIFYMHISLKVTLNIAYSVSDRLSH